MNAVNIKNSKNITFCTISLMPSQNYVYVEWIGFIDEAETSKTACQEVVEFIQHSEKSLLLNDNRRQTGPWPPINKWIGEVWIPSMIEAGLRKFAHIYSPNYFSELSAKKNLRDDVSGIKFGHFSNEKKARKWLVGRSEALPNV